MRLGGRWEGWQVAGKGGPPQGRERPCLEVCWLRLVVARELFIYPPLRPGWVPGGCRCPGAFKMNVFIDSFPRVAATGTYYLPSPDSLHHKRPRGGGVQQRCLTSKHSG